MKTEIFAAEISLDAVKLKHKSIFNGTQVRAYLGGLSVSYDEVFIMSNAQHVLMLATGQSPILIISALKELMPSVSEILTTSAQDAVASFISIAKGERWKDVSMMEIRGMILNASDLAMESDCFGETLRRLTEAALVANAKTWRRIEERHYQLVITNPSIESADFSKISYN